MTLYTKISTVLIVRKIANEICTDSNEKNTKCS